MNSVDATQKYLYLAGINVGHSISPAIHNRIAQGLGKAWTCENFEAPTAEHMMAVFRRSDFAGGVITMPYKRTIMPLLDGVDDLAIKLGACNNVYIAADGTLRGTNTDYKGISGSLLEAKPRKEHQIGMVYGAGGASRAAIFSLSADLGCKTIYIVNRDNDEVATLIEDVQSFSPPLVHVKSVLEAQQLETPYYVVSTVPDFPAITPGEREARAVLAEFLSKTDQGVFLDMCYHPRMTRNLMLAMEFHWTTVEGVKVVGHQAGEQWRLWAQVPTEEMPWAEVWNVLQDWGKSNP